MLAPTAEKADKMVDERLAVPVTADANDFLYQWEPRTITIPPPGLEKIEATLLAINAADDERNPPETGVTEAAMKRIKNGKLYLIPASTETRGHLTTGNAKFYKQQLQELLQTAPQKDDVTAVPIVPTPTRAVMRWILAALFCAAGIAHLWAPDKLLAITPSWVPFAPQVILGTGLCEIAGAVALVTRTVTLVGRRCAGGLCDRRLAREFQARHRRRRFTLHRQ